MDTVPQPERSNLAPGRRALNRLDLAILVGVVLLALVVRVIPGPRTIDDAFITFRYSRNIVEGQGFVYNPGSQVLGTTTPLYTLMMAAISGVLHGEDFQIYALLVNALADAATAVLLFLLVRRLTNNRAMGALLAVLWAIAPYSVTFAVGGMETSVVILCMVGAFWLYVNNQPIWMGVVAALGFLTRIDAAIWIGLLFLFQLGEAWLAKRDKAWHTRIPWRTWLAFGLTVLPWLIFSQFYFGSLLPHTLSAKTAAYLVPPWSMLGWLIPRYGTPFSEFDTFGAVGAMLSTLIYLILSMIGISHTARKLPRLLPFLIYPWLYLMIFAIANPPTFRWYALPPIPALMLSIVAGVWTVIDGLHKRLRKRPVKSVAIVLLTLLWGGTSLHDWTLHPDNGADRPAPIAAWHQIELDYQQMAAKLVGKYGVTSATVVASADIGTIGYFTRARIVDTVGLVTPELSTYYPVSPGLIVEGQNYAIPPQLILDTRPMFFVTMEAFVRLGLEQDPTFKAQYGDPVESILTGFYGTDMRVYERKTGTP